MAGPLDRNASRDPRTRRAFQRIKSGGLGSGALKLVNGVYVVATVYPLASSANGLALQVAPVGGLTLAGQSLSVLLDPVGALGMGAAGIKALPDSSTIVITGNALAVKDGGIATAKLSDGAVTAAKLADANVTTGKIADGAVTPAKLSFSFPNFADGETPAGAIDGANTTFTLAHAPSASSLHLYRNGLRISPAAYTATGNSFTMSVAPTAGDTLLADYRY